MQPTRLLRPWDFLGKSTGVALDMGKTAAETDCEGADSQRLLLDTPCSPQLDNKLLLKVESEGSILVSNAHPSTPILIRGGDLECCLVHYLLNACMNETNWIRLET